MKSRYLIAALCTPLLLAACDRADDSPPKPEVVASNPGARNAGPIQTGPAGTAYPVPPSSSIVTQPAPAAAKPAADKPAEGAAPPAAQAPAAETPAGASQHAKDTPANAPGGDLTKEEEKNKMPMAGQNHGYSSDARKAGQTEATPTAKDGDTYDKDEKVSKEEDKSATPPAAAATSGQSTAAQPAGSGKPASTDQAAAAATPAGASEHAKDSAANAPGDLTKEEEKNKMPMAGQNHGYSSDARKAGQNEATTTAKDGDTYNKDQSQSDGKGEKTDEALVEKLKAEVARNPSSSETAPNTAASTDTPK